MVKHESRGGRPLRIVFAGTPEFAVQHLKVLLGNDSAHEVVAVYTQPDRPAGRGKKLASSPVKTLAEIMGLPVYQPVSLKDPEQQLILTSLRPDLIVVVAYGLLLPPKILNIPKYGCVNVHASLLPRWRGAAPIQRAIEAGDTKSGVTIMQMDTGLDTGDMLNFVECKIASDETGGSLQNKMSAIGPSALLHTLEKIARGESVPVKQDSALSTYAAKLTKDEAFLDWSMPAEKLSRKILAFNPSQVACTTLNNEHVRIWHAEPSIACEAVIPGTIISTNNDGIQVGTGQGSLLITQLQLPGKNRLQASEVLRSKAVYFSPGNIFGQKADDQ